MKATQEQIDKGKAKPIEWLSCCCCGNSTKGRQWWNRDNGFGLCDDCVTYCHADPTPGHLTDSYGISGVHFLIKNGEKSDNNLCCNQHAEDGDERSQG